MKKAMKKRVGRPPGRTAPRRPVLSTVLSARVSESFQAMVREAARASGRTISEEVIWRAEQSFVWERAHVDARSVLAEANSVATKNLEARLQEEMRRLGYTRIRGMNGAAWFEPGVNAIQWIFDSFDSSSRAVLEEMLERAAARALEKLGRES
jgi:hypothetical protein